MIPVVIPAAGYGTRSLPASKAIPKEMLTIFDRPTIQYVVDEAAASGVKDVVFVTSRGKSSIEDHFDQNPELEAALSRAKKDDLLKIVRDLASRVTIRSVRQKEMRGLGHAVLMAKTLVQSTSFGVMLGDDLVEGKVPGMKQLMDKHIQLPTGSGVVLLMKVADADVSKYGICDIADEKTLKISRCVEKPKPTETKSRMAIIGRYLLPIDIFEKLEACDSGALGEIQLTDALNRLAAEGRLYGHLLEGRRFDAGDRLGFLEATLFYALQGPLRESVKKIIKEFA
jgi:UTP--glucose-1-phosphate uridylyltransferase